MPIEGIQQPEFLPVDDALRLRRYDGVCDAALDWYQDEEMVYLVDGVRRKYTPELLRQMYDYLNRKGELYFIEVRQDEVWRPIGDVTFCREDMPIVIGDSAFRGRGIGKKVIARLMQRGRELGYDTLFVEEIYDWNPASQKCFTALGFAPCGKTEKGSRYKLSLE
ncbi:MAG: GNAT family N-acetyltransferase [Oscillospiraceae bacterium]|nr:GNAT family N-acetyltransferase [Oscillospiraceae bacterium]